MWYNVLLRWLNRDSTNNRRGRSQGPAQRPSPMPCLLLLEDRTMLSTLTVLNNADRGNGSLRATIAAAQSGDQIVFDQSLHGQTISLTSGELAITKSLDIEGLGADQLAVSGYHHSRIVNVSGGVTVTIAGLTITAGFVAPGTTDALGGGLFNNGGDVTLDHVALQNNQAQADIGSNARGGGLYSVGGSITVSDSTIAGNQAADGAGAYGADGGGIFNSGGDIMLDHVVLQNNMAQAGTNYYGNTGNARGGGLYSASGSVAISDSIIAGNQASGGMGAHGSVQGGTGAGGGIYTTGGSLTIADSTIASNHASGGRGADVPSTPEAQGGASQGGGLYVNGGMLTLADSTITANTLQGGAGGSGFDDDCGGASQGGGLWVATGVTAQVSFSTIATNQATGGSGGGGGPATGGGVYNQGMLQTRDTLLAGNTVNGPGTNSGPDLAGDLGSLGHNLISNSDGGRGFDATDLLDVDPLLGPLQNNGGPTQTMALLPGSPAIDAGDKTGHPHWDQRGRPYHRVVNHRLDIGAFEVQSDDPGPSIPGDRRAEVPFLTVLISSLASPTDYPAIGSAVPFRGPAAIPSLSRDVVPKEPISFEPGAVDQVFASFERDAHRPRLIRRRDLEPIQFIWLNPGFLMGETGLIR
jgi:hypothetical protein